VNERDRGQGDRRLVFRGLGWNAIGYPLNVGLLFASHVLAANLLTKRGFGTYSLAFTIFVTLALIVQLGLPHSLLRRAATALGRGDEHEAAHEVVSALLFGALVGVVVGVVFGSPGGPELLDLLFPATGVGSVALLVGLRTALRVIENIVPEALRAYRDFVRVVLFDGLLANVLFAGTLVVLLLTTEESSVRELMVAGCVVAVVALVPALIAVFRKLESTRKAGFSIRNPLEPSMWAVTIGRTLVAQLDLLVVGALASSRAVAQYAAPFRLALLVGMPLIAVNQVLPPLLAGWHARGQLRRTERVVGGTAGLALIASFVLAVGFLLVGKQVLDTLFGHEYRDAYSILMILAAGQVLQTVTGSCGFALMMTGNSAWYAKILGVSTVVTLGAQVLGYELWGLDGVALATAGSLVAQNVVQAIAVKRLAGFSVWANPRAALLEARRMLKRSETD
jgi:O-antigen/teichoic acid export membrane protein